ncbi:MAG: hypothetical protein ACQEW0_16525 [Pseudomonadota bacterium]
MSWLNDADVVMPKTAAEKLADAQEKAIKRINDAYTADARPLIGEYPEVEQKSWLAQEREARAYLAWYDDQQGDAPKTPMLDKILTGRNGENGTETLHDLSVAVIDNANAFTEFQELTGKRQRLVKQIRNAETPEAAEAVTW